MKKINRVILMALALCLGFCLQISAASEGEYVFDDADIFTESEIENIEDAISEITNDQIAYVIGTTDRHYYDREQLADAFCDKHGISQHRNLVLLIIDMSDPSEVHYDMYTYGNAWDKISDAEVDRIIYNDNVYDDLKTGEFLSGTLSFLELSGKAYDGHLSMNVGTVALIAVISGVIAASITCACVIVKYKTKLKSASYPIDKYAKLDLRDKRDIFLGSSISKVRVQSSSGGSRGGGGGGGGHRGGA